VEFAFVGPLFLLVVFGVLDFARLLNYWNDGTHIANEGARWAAVNQNPGSGTLQQYILAQGDTAELRNNSKVCITFPTNPDTGTSGQVGDPVKVAVTTTFHWLPFIRRGFSPGNTTINATGSALLRLEQAPTSFSVGAGGTGTCP
jgi:hypothetical protein